MWFDCFVFREREDIQMRYLKTNHCYHTFNLLSMQILSMFREKPGLKSYFFVNEAFSPKYEVFNNRVPTLGIGYSHPVNEAR